MRLRVHKCIYMLQFFINHIKCHYIYPVQHKNGFAYNLKCLSVIYSGYLSFAMLIQYY